MTLHLEVELFQCLCSVPNVAPDVQRPTKGSSVTCNLCLAFFVDPLLSLSSDTECSPLAKKPRICGIIPILVGLYIHQVVVNSKVAKTPEIDTGRRGGTG
jgi:hypothetical protein